MEPGIILYVDDDPDDTMLFRQALDECWPGLQVRDFSDGQAVLDALHQADDKALAEVAVMVVDVNLPKRNGLEVVKEIKNTPRLKHIPVIMWTGSAIKQDLDVAYSLGCNAYMVKPATYAE